MNPALRAECARVAPILQAPPEPLDPRALMVLFARQAPSLSLPAFDRPDAFGDMGDVYVRTLGHLPIESVEAAFQMWHRGEMYPKEPGRHGFFPKPVELLTLAERHLATMRTAAYRAKVALSHVEKSGVEWTPQRKAEERAKSIAAGHLTPDGRVRFPEIKRVVTDVRPSMSQHEVAERLRAKAAHPETRGVGDVL